MNKIVNVEGFEANQSQRIIDEARKKCGFVPNPNAEEFVPQKAKFHFENQVVREAEDISQTDSLSSDEVDLTPKKDSQTRRERSEGQRIPKVILTHQISYNYLHRENVKSYYQKWIEDPAQSPRNLLEYPGSSLQNVEDLSRILKDF